jgi:hypothetical protein
MNKLLRFAILVCAFTFLSSQASAKKPDWIDGTSKKYPEPHYFIGMGEAMLGKGSEKQVHSLAADRARAEIAKSIRSSVSVDERSGRKVESSAKGKSRDLSQDSYQSSSVRISAGQILEDVQIKEYYKDKKEGRLYALAALDRPKAAKRLSARLDQVLKEISTEMEMGREAQDAGNYLPAMKRYSNALSLSSGASDIAELISILKPAGPSPLSEGLATAEIKELISRLGSMIAFEIKINDENSAIRPYIVRGLKNYGFSVGADTAGAKKSYTLDCRIDIIEKGTIDMGPGLLMNVYQADLDVEITDTSDGNVIGSMTWSANANEKSSVAAEKSAVRALGRLVEKQIGEKLVGI